MMDPYRLSDPLDRLIFGPFVPTFDPFRLWIPQRDLFFRPYPYPDSGSYPSAVPVVA